MSEGLARKIFLDEELLAAVDQAIAVDAEVKSGSRGLAQSVSSKLKPAKMSDRITQNKLSKLSAEISKISILLLESIFESEEFNSKQTVNAKLTEVLHHKLRARLGLLEIAARPSNFVCLLKFKELKSRNRINHPIIILKFINNNE